MLPSKSFLKWWKNYHNAGLFRTILQAVYFTACNIAHKIKAR